MRVVFMGTPDFAVGSLEAVFDAGYPIEAVVTQPDRPKGRRGEAVASPVKEFAASKGIPVFQPEKIRTPEAIGMLADYQPDVIIVAAFGQILPKEVLELPPLGCINIHASLLPKYRGASPIQGAILNGDRETGITIMQMDEGLDTGAILLQKGIPIEAGETSGTLFEKLALFSKSLILEALAGLEKGSLKPIPQEEGLATKTKIIKKSDGRIDWRKGAAELERMIRAYDPWPGAFTMFRQKQMKIYRAEVVELSQGAPGEALFADKDGFAVCCGEGALKVMELQMEGKKRLPAAQFLKGCRVSPERN
ncbi:MAG: methionyl-tRNA formyltransferase [Lachnospiraceae bacterium]|nr:methionyl-tRNA formyltransferase [Lachnospiraceae bacterium]